MVRLRFIVAKAASIFRSDPGGRRRPFFQHKQQGSPLSFPEIFRCLRLPPGDPWQFYFGSAYISGSARFIVVKAALIFRPDPGGRRRPYFYRKQQGSPLSFPEIFRCLRLFPADPWQFYFGSAYISISARFIVVEAALIFGPDPGVRRRPYFRDQQQGSTSSFPDNFRCLRLLPDILWQFYFGSAYMSGSVFWKNFWTIFFGSVFCACVQHI